MMSVSKDIERCTKLWCLGCRGGKRMQQTLICQWLMIFCVIYIWSWYNGGLLPTFLSTSPTSAALGKSDIIRHFGYNINGDGLKVTWAHAANSKRSMSDAVKSDVMMIEGDILFKGYNTDTQQLVPVMAHPPQIDSDITLMEWLDMAAGTGKGIKLDFKSIECVELSLQILHEKQSKLNVPVHLSAEVAEGPNSFMAPNKFLDPQRFIKQCKSASPGFTLALGWTNGWSDDGEKVYTWSMVKAMYDIVEEQAIQQSLTFNVRAKLVKSSITQLKWLMEMTDATLTLFSPGEDNLKSNDILNVRHRLPQEKIFYDIQESIKADLHSVPQDGGVDERQMFQLSQWKAVRSKGGEKIYLGSEALIFQNGLLVSKEEHRLQPGASFILIKGRVEFINIPTVPEEGDSKTSPVGLGVFLRVSQSSVASIVSGIRCFIGFDGHLEISTQSIPGVDRKQDATVTGTLPCFSFEISDYPDLDKIVMIVSRLKVCSDTVSEIDDEHVTKVEFSLKDILIESHYMAMRAPSTQAFVVVDHFQIN